MSKSISRCLGLFVLLQGLFWAGIVVPAEKAADFNEQVRSWDRTIERIANRVQSGRTGSPEDRDLRRQLQKIIDSAAAVRVAAVKEAGQVNGLLESLGPPPEDKAKAEAATVQKRRKELGAELVTHEGRAKQAGLLIAKAEQTLADISRRSRKRLTVALFERTVTPLSYKAWTIAMPEAAQLFDASFIEAPGKWWAGVQTNPVERESLLHNLFIALVAAIAGWPLGRWLRARYGRVQGIKKPSYGRRLLAGLVEGGGRTLAPIIFIILMGSLAVEGDLIEEPLATIVQTLVKNLVLFFLGYALINAAWTPRRIEWRLLDFGEEAARLLVFRLKLILVVFLVFDGVFKTISWETSSAELESVSAFVFTLALVPLLISLLGSRLWAQTSRVDAATSGPTVSRFSRLRVLLTMGLAALPVAAVLGYPGLVTYLMRAVIMSGLVLGGLGLLRSVGRESFGAFLDDRRPIGRWIRDTLALDREALERTLFWLRVIFDLGLLVLAGLALLPVWGFGAGETAASAGKVMRGVQIGSYTLSLIDFLIGLFLFAAILLLTGFIKKGLDRHILPNLTKDKGVQAALKSGVGYIGFIIAALIAISAFGLDLTNLALIAGALSVGLGFGLQNVVSNFVSGLILLAERPIKPGDWVVIGNHEGKVMRVNVRSTEIETFQRASVIIPNADLISSPVINWTHKNMMGRVEIAVGVAYGTDPHLVESVMLDCARAHPNVLADPEPFFLFIDFGESSLNFEVRAYLANVEKRLSSGSEIRFAIHDAFKDKGVEIPFPQRVLHFAAVSSKTSLPGGEKA